VKRRDGLKTVTRFGCLKDKCKPFASWLWDLVSEEKLCMGGRGSPRMKLEVQWCWIRVCYFNLLFQYWDCYMLIEQRRLHKYCIDLGCMVWSWLNIAMVEMLILKIKTWEEGKGVPFMFDGVSNWAIAYCLLRNIWRAFDKKNIDWQLFNIQ
jgi:hypothetical protein